MVRPAQGSPDGASLLGDPATRLGSAPHRSVQKRSGSRLVSCGCGEVVRRDWSPPEFEQLHAQCAGREDLDVDAGPDWSTLLT